MTDLGLHNDVAIVPMPGAAFGVVTFLGDPNHLKDEILRDYEMGYRAELGKRFSLDLATFRSFYGNLSIAEPGTPYFAVIPGPPHLVFPLFLEDLAHGRSYGGELFVNWNIGRRWRISPGYSLLHLSMTPNPASQGLPANQNPGYSPNEQFQIRSLLDLPHNFEWDATVAYVGALQSTNIPGYTRLDTRLGRRIGEYLEFSVVGQNLLMPRHAEFPDEYGLNHTLLERSLFVKLTWRL